MVIQDSTIRMSAKSAFYAKRASVSYAGWGDQVGSVNTSASTLPQATDGIQKKAEIIPEDSAVYHSLMEPHLSEDAGFDNKGKIEFNALKNLLGVFSNKNLVKPRKLTTMDLFELLMGQFKERLKSISENLGRSSGTNMAYGTTVSYTKVDYYSCDLYTESERLSYATTGTVVTGDGRKIDIDVSAVMSRSFTQETDVHINYSEYKLIDPLIINLNGNEPVDLSEKRFLFDLDMDGEEDNISLLAKGCGFLALDRNEDGIINNGSELFGAGTGNGFEELAVFDLDGNGWIDENDEVFNRLRIWLKDDSGEDKLVALGVAGVGAIYLGNAAGNFQIKTAEKNETLGQITHSGIYLRENGEVGQIQQTELAC